MGLRDASQFFYKCSFSNSFYLMSGSYGWDKDKYLITSSPQRHLLNLFAALKTLDYSLIYYL